LTFQKLVKFIFFPFLVIDVILDHDKQVGKVISCNAFWCYISLGIFLTTKLQSIFLRFEQKFKMSILNPLSAKPLSEKSVGVISGIHDIGT